jgi:hypothetical protein
LSRAPARRVSFTFSPILDNMRRERVVLGVLLCLALTGSPAVGGAQTADSAAAAARPDPPVPALFATHEPLVFTITTDVRRLLRDRGTNREEHGGVLRYVGAAGDTLSLNVDLKTRGIFRLKQCAFPPLRLDLPASRVKGTIFAHQDKLKLVTHCRGASSYEQSLLEEYVLYKVFNVITERSFRARLARVTYLDSTAHEAPLTRYAILLEADEDLAKRMRAKVLESTTIHDLRSEPEQLTLVSVFQYLIGNTDWSIWGLHNMAVFQDTTAKLYPIPYDFDFAGVISAPYAIPAPQLPIKTVRERLYRGFCQPEPLLQSVLARFRAGKDSIYALVRSVPDLSPGEVRGTLDYFDGFYRTINNPGDVHRTFIRGCRPTQ